MTDQEKYLFDLQGFLVVPNALSADAVAALNAVLDEKLTAREQEEGDNKTTYRFGRLLTWGDAYRDLIDNERITPYLSALLGEQFRLDHDYCDVIRQGLGPIGATLHGGATPFDPTAYYVCQNGTLRNGLTVVAYNLHDVHPGDGGFACVPGSHKSKFPIPAEWRNLETPQPFVVPVTGPAGTAIIFTEALTHGTLPWRGNRERRTVFYKYSPNPLAWAVPPYEPEQYEGLTDAQWRILEGPNARYKGRKTDPAR